MRTLQDDCRQARLLLLDAGGEVPDWVRMPLRVTTAERLAEAGLTVKRPCVKCGQDASTGPARITSAGTRHVGGCP